MFKPTLLITALMLFTSLSSIYAQKKISVGFSELRYSPATCSERAAIGIYNYIVTAFYEAQRFRVLDREYDKVVQDEKELQKDGSRFIDSETIVKQGKELGAQWMVGGQIVAASAIRTAEGGYETHVSFFLRIFDVETGEVVAAEAISPSGRFELNEEFLMDKILPKENPAVVDNQAAYETALAIGLQKVTPFISSFIRENFPIELDFYKIEEDGKKTVTT